MDFKAGDFARTRDGRKAFISDIKDELEYPIIGVILGENKITSWMKDGKWWNKDTNHHNDLIGPWEEPQPTDYRAGWRFYAGAALTGLLHQGFPPPAAFKEACDMAEAMMEEEGKL